MEEFPIENTPFWSRLTTGVQNWWKWLVGGTVIATAGTYAFLKYLNTKRAQPDKK